jgi:cell division protein FtsN
MNEEYLWDKSGEPDSEIQELEQILGALRFQPKPLDLSDEVQPRSRNRYLTLIAIAATLLIALIGGALWLRVRSKTVPQLNNAQFQSPKPQQVIPKIEDKKTKDILAAVPDKPSERRPKVKEVKHRTLEASNMTASERQQALEAKEQLMIALRLTSEKLNLAHRKTQGASPNQIRNQHKVG